MVVNGWMGLAHQLRLAPCETSIPGTFDVLKVPFHSLEIRTYGRKIHLQVSFSGSDVFVSQVKT